ncbi:hypothetical protein HPP92_007100 [Vanilla planifolia]|uniref:Iron-binding zinc finger CDGSH type domain-containing protein n=1 Tax=Vanilla planifolia TaxID=51239 RepID=A0A835V9B4_VANPL|nr:hypothetical protein HPP92_007351 [Vanilla planifolia]KAG0490237.1 hypothetical protein HPP92_007100 [Vanilla planifolia]
MAAYTCIVSTIGFRFASSTSADSIKQRRSMFYSSQAPYRRRAASLVVRAEGRINPDIRKNEEKVVDSVVISELSKSLTAFCRCWRSGTFPLCDGSHVKHNKATDDNVAPLLVKK